MSNLRLFDPLVEESKMNPNFISAYSESYPYVRDLINQWAEGFQDRDGKFIKEFQTTFNSSFWEIYLFSILKKLGFSVDFSVNRPDFTTKQFCMEATIASHPIGGKPEWENKFKNMEDWSLDRAVNLSTIRIANSFISKAQKYIDSYSCLSHVKDKPFVIAIAPFEQPYFYTQSQHAIRRVLYSFDRIRAIDWDEETREVLGNVYMEEIEKENGSSIPLGYFLNAEFSGISAVIFSNTATWGKARVLSKDPRLTLVKAIRFNDEGLEPLDIVEEKTDYKETLLDGLTILHNPFARYPISKSWFNSSEIAHISYDIANKELISEFPHGFLFQRIVNVINIGKNDNESVERIKDILKNKTSKMEASNPYPKLHN